MNKERFACTKCKAFYECCKPHMKATAGGWKVEDIDGRKVLEVCALHLRTSAGILDFQDHGYTWWLTRKAAMQALA